MSEVTKSAAVSKSVWKKLPTSIQQITPVLTDKEARKIYVEKNKEKIKLKMKELYERDIEQSRLKSNEANRKCREKKRIEKEQFLNDSLEKMKLQMKLTS